MKTIFATIALALSVLSASAQYQGSFLQTTEYNGGTNKVMALTTNAFFLIDVARTEYVALFCDFKYLNAPGAGDVNAIRLDLYRGVDSGTFESNIWQSITFAAGSSTTAGSTCTNITVAGIPAIRGRFASVSTNSHATNFTFSYSFKR